MLTAKLTLELSTNYNEVVAIVLEELDGTPRENTLSSSPYSVFQKLPQVEEALNAREHIEEYGSDKWKCGDYIIRRPQFRDINLSIEDAAGGLVDTITRLMDPPMSRTDVLNLPYPVYMSIVDKVKEDSLGAITFPEPPKITTGSD